MVAELAAVAVLLVVGTAELIHFARCRAVARLAFGPGRRPRAWASLAPWLRVGSLTALTWGLVTLMLISPKIHKAATISEEEIRHIVMVLDVSPSMRLDDAGPSNTQTRMNRASDLMESFFNRVPMEQYRVSVIAVYTGAKQVVVDTRDIEVVRNILTDLPMHHAFESGQTELFSGLEEAANIAKPWNPRSTTVLVISDGDTVPATGMPQMPPSVSNVLIVGVGDPRKGKFIDGRNSRQDTSTLRGIATRLGGTYHNGNEKQVTTETLNMLMEATQASPLSKLTRREYALTACGLGGIIVALLPLLLHYVGSAWKPGVPAAREPMKPVEAHSI